MQNRAHGTLAPRIRPARSAQERVGRRKQSRAPAELPQGAQGSTSATRTSPSTSPPGHGGAMGHPRLGRGGRVGCQGDGSPGPWAGEGPRSPATCSFVATTASRSHLGRGARATCLRAGRHPVRGASVMACMLSHRLDGGELERAGAPGAAQARSGREKNASQFASRHVLRAETDLHPRCPSLSEPRHESDPDPSRAGPSRPLHRQEAPPKPAVPVLRLRGIACPTADPVVVRAQHV